ncbi:hypothetical protein GCM10028826_34310 [Mucilaginibacter boryungensis]
MRVDIFSSAKMNLEPVAFEHNIGRTYFGRKEADEFKAQDVLIVFGCFFGIANHDLRGDTGEDWF